ncbi:MAG TPA: DUF4394 domain-containing protein [Trichocoleus sp.]|jgi:hypothetical protein
MAQDSGYKFSEAVKVKLDQGKLKLKGSISAPGEFDVYQFKLNRRSKFDCSLNLNAKDVEFTLFDRQGNQVAVSDNSSGDDNSNFVLNRSTRSTLLSIQKTLKAGLYFLGIRSLAQDTETQTTAIDYSCNSSTIELPGQTYKEALKINSNKNKLKGTYSYSGSLSSDNPVGFYQFDLTQQSSFTSFLNSLGNNVAIELYDSNQQRVTVSGSNLQLLDAGKYFVKLKLKAKGESIDYKLKLKFDAVPIDFSGNSLNEARVVSASPSVSVFKDYVGLLDSDDYYKVNVASPSSLNLVLDGLSADANLQVMDQSGAVVGSSNNTGTAKDLLNLSVKGGTYYVRVTAGTNASTNYNLSFTSAPLKLFGLASDGTNVVAFNPDRPTDTVKLGITGLTAGETLKAIDFQTSTGDLFGLSSANKLYKIDVATGAATTMTLLTSTTTTGTTSTTTTTSPLTLTGTVTGFDFDPSSGKIRVVTDADENRTLTPVAGSTNTFTVATDTTLAYATGDVNAAQNPNVTALAYNNNFRSSTSTTPYGIDTTLDTLVRLAEVTAAVVPAPGNLTTVGALGVDFSASAGFDIFTDSTLSNTAYAVSGSDLYSINLTSGAATKLGAVSVSGASTPLVGIASRV